MANQKGLINKMNLTVEGEKEENTDYNDTKLKNIKHYLPLLFNQINDAVIITDLDFIITVFNKSAESLYGWKADEVINKPMADIIPTQYINDDRGIVLKEFKSKGFWNGEVIQNAKDGSKLFIDASVNVLVDDEGNPIGVSAINRDITDIKKAENKLIESEKNLKQAQKLAKIGSWSWVKEIDKVSWSDELFEITGLNPKKGPPTYSEHYNLYTKESWKKLSHAVEIAVNKGKSYDLELDMIQSDGSIRHTHTKGTSLIDESGKIVGLLGTVHDVTDKKKAEKSLIENEEKFRNIAEQNIMGVCILQDNVIKYTNKAMASLYGYTVEEVLNWKPMEFYKLFTPETLKIAKEQALKKQRGDSDQLVHYIVHGIKKNGDLIWANNYSRTISYQNRPADLVTQIDITDKKIAEDALKDSREIFKTIVETTPSLLLISDIKGNVSYVSPNSKEFTGYNPEEFIGTIKWWVHPDDLEKCKKIFEKVYKEKVSGRDFEYKAIKKNGDVWYASSSWECIKDINGDFNGIVMQTIDITDKRIKEIHLKKQFMKFKVEEGNIYLLTERDNIQKITAMNDLEKVGYNRYIISRNTEEQTRYWIKGTFEYRRLAESKTPYSILPKIESIRKYIQNIPKNSVILIERLDYLITKNNFKKVLQLVQYLNEQAYLNNHIILLAIDISILKPVELKLLIHETQRIEAQDKIKLPDDMLEILKFIYNYNLRGEKPAQADIVKATGLSKPTIIVKMRELIKYGYITVTLRGKSKRSEITEKTRNLLEP